MLDTLRRCKDTASKNLTAAGIAIAVGLLAITAEAQQPIFWQPVSQWFIDPGQVALHKPNAVYVMAQIAPNSCGQAVCTAGPQTPRTWNTVDLTQMPYRVNSAAKVAALVCDLIITGSPINNASNTASADPVGASGWFPHIHVTFRATGDTSADPTGYVGDVESSLRGDGTRTNFSVLVPLSMGRFDYLIDYDDSLPPYDGTNTGGPAYGVNCTLQAWGQ
jgi:hypothetical protein